MKSVILFCVSVFILFSCSDKNEDTKMFKLHFTEKSTLMKIERNVYDGANFSTVRSVNNLKKKYPKDWMADYSSNIKKMVILTTIPTKDKDKVNNVINEILKFCKENGYADTLNTDLSGKSTNVFSKASNEQVSGLIIISIEDFKGGAESVEARCIKGNFSSEEVGKIAAIHSKRDKKIYGKVK